MAKQEFVPIRDLFGESHVSIDGKLVHQSSAIDFVMSRIQGILESQYGEFADEQLNVIFGTTPAPADGIWAYQTAAVEWDFLENGTKYMLIFGVDHQKHFSREQILLVREPDKSAAAFHLSVANFVGEIPFDGKEKFGDSDGTELRIHNSAKIIASKAIIQDPRIMPIDLNQLVARLPSSLTHGLQH
jgi:hypothetical protein